MYQTDRLLSLALVATLSLMLGCSSEDAGVGGSDGINEIFPAQTFRDDFDSGLPDARWGCTLPDLPGYFCNWEVVAAGPLDPSASTADVNTLPPSALMLPTAATVGVDNFVFQSPDPEALEPNRRGSCERFSVEFEQAGTFAFNYFVRTAGPVPPVTDGNYLEVNLVKNIVEFNPDFDENIPIASERTTLQKWSGNESGRYSTSLEPGFYDFEFCYLRYRTSGIGPDFVQIDDVETCVGTSCLGAMPTVARCQADQGQTLVPDISTLPTHVITVAPVQGTVDRYHVIINTQVLDFLSGTLGAGGPQFDILRSQIDGVRNVVLVDGKTCDIDERKSVLIEMSRAELINLVAATGVVDAALSALESEAADRLYEMAAEYIAGEIVGTFLEEITERLIISAVKAAL